MSRTIGRVDFLVDFDGRSLPAQARQVGGEVGDAAGTAATKRFADKFTPLGRGALSRLSADGRLAGFRISESMERAVESRLAGLSDKIANAFLTPEGLDNFSRNFERVDDAARDLRVSLQELHDSGNLNEEMWGRFGGTLNQWLGKARAAESEADEYRRSLVDLRVELDRQVENHDRVNESFARITPNIELAGAAAKKSGRDADSGGAGWRGLSHNLRQALLITAAIVAGAQQIATLGSAAGVGLTVIGAAAIGAGVGITALVIGLQNILGDLEALPEAARPAAAAVQGLGDDFKAMQREIQAALLDGLGPAIENLSGTLLPSLQQGLVDVAASMNESIGGVLDRLASPETQSRLGQIFDDIQVQVPLLVTAIGNIGSAIGGILIAAGPYVNQFATWLERITGEFDEFVNSVEGKNQLAEWFRNGTAVLGAFERLLGAVGKALAGLVTEDSVQRTVDLLDNLAEAMPFLVQLGETVGELDVFGLIAQALADLGNGLRPILDLLTPLFSIVNSLLTPALKQLEIALQLVGLLLTPLKFGLDFIALAFEKIVEYVEPFLDVWSDVLTEIQAAADSIWTELEPSISDLMDTIIDLLPEPEEMARLIRDEVIPAIKEFAGWLKETAIPALELTIEAIQNFLEEFDFEAAWKAADQFLKDIQFWAERFVRFMLGPVGIVMDLIDAINILNGKSINGPGGGGGQAALFQASGGINSGPTLGWTGEAGPEAIVPLQRDLNQVDPTVRWLSAIAQGKAPLAADGETRINNIEEGAIVIVAGTAPAEDVAKATLDEIIDKLP